MSAVPSRSARLAHEHGFAASRMSLWHIASRRSRGMTTAVSQSRPTTRCLSRSTPKAIRRQPCHGHDEPVDRLAVISSESQRLADVLSEVDPERRCPTCPDWSAADLLWHLTNVHFFWAGILKRRVVDAGELPAIERAKPGRPEALTDMLGLREHATAELVEQLARRDDDERCWSWWPPDQTVGFTRRMQTYEATMHRVDAELTAGQPVTMIADDVAAGAVDHAVDVMWGWLPDDATYRTDANVEFVASDTGLRWLVEVGSWTATNAEDGSVDTGMRARRANGAEPTAVVSGSVADLALWAWTRGGSVEVSGERSSMAALAALISEGMQ